MNEKQLVIGEGKRLRLERKADALVAFAFLLGLTPILILLSTGALSKIDSTLGAVSFANRLVALVGTTLLLFHLILVARVPWIERVFGLDRLTGSHKRLAKPLIYLVVVHVLLSGIYSSVQDGSSLLEAFTHVAFNYQEMVAATIGFALMLAVMFSSIRVARAHLKYEYWYLIHLSAYLAVALSIPHQLVFGTDFLTERLLVAYFVALYVFVMINVIWFRALSNFVRSFARRLEISKVEPEGNDSTSLYVAGKNLETMGVKSGQFFMLRIMTLRDFWKPHPFSVSSSANEDFIRFTIGNRGDDTARIKELAVGTKVVLEGPYGVFTEVKRTRQKVTMFAGGMGIAPIRSLAREIVSMPGDVTIIYRMNSEKDSALADEIKLIAEQKGFTLHFLIGPRSTKTTWLPADLGNGERNDHVILTDLSPDIIDSDIFICGPTPWVNSLNKTLMKLNIPSHQIHIEEFAW